MWTATNKNTPQLVSSPVLGHLRSVFKERISSQKSWLAVKHIQGVGIYLQAQRSLSHWVRQEGDGTRCSYDIAAPPPPKKGHFWAGSEHELTASLVLRYILYEDSGPNACCPTVPSNMEAIRNVGLYCNISLGPPNIDILKSSLGPCKCQILRFIITPYPTPGGTPAYKWCDLDLKFWQSNSLVCMTHPK